MATALALLLHHLRHYHLLLLLLLQPIFYSGSEIAPMSDVDALLLLKNSFTDAAALSSWTPATSPCDPKSPWTGVVCIRGVITAIRLSGMGLSGTINVDALSHFTGLRAVSFANNSFTGGIPALGRLTALKSIYLSNNRLSGVIPGEFFDDIDRLKKLWLDGNDFTGPIPYSLSKSTALMELRLENNHFSGTLPALVLPSLSSFNVSNNELEGVIPDVYNKFNASSFMGNKGLCGMPLPSKPCMELENERTVSRKMAALLIVALIVVCLIVYMIAKREKHAKVNEFESSSREMGIGENSLGSPPEKYSRAISVQKNAGHMRMASSMSMRSTNGGSGAATSVSAAGGGGGGAGGTGDLVMVNEGKGAFGLAELMKATAEVMGSSSLGSAYKAVMANGVAVVVKRMRDMNRIGKELFDAELRRLGAFCHPNVLPPLAYHYRKDEKLMVVEYIPKGSLLYVLHGDRGIDHSSLDWPTRTKIARGVARGLAYLHAELPSSEAPHGNLKSSNVLLAPDFEPLLADYGFLALVNPAQAGSTMQAHQSPEVIAGGLVTPRSDIYCLGVLILELLTGKYPSQYLSSANGGIDVVNWVSHFVGEGREAEILDPAIVAGAHPSSLSEMKRLVRVGVECSEADPNRRLELREAVERIEEVAVEAEKAPPPSSAEYRRDGLGEQSSRRAKSVGEISARRMASIGARSARQSDDSVLYTTS
ncbi:hypothetical protein Cni_G28641 [Canna indica]|uniref:Protein kinase domain-containing protein n=1 Tax=Canna indica TaxID=4628 RepID=A0AAQ3L3U0_9LILI|nr:hypothetical protein Cni_G28641 [Canna indica]